MSGLGEFGALADLSAIRNALGKIKTWSRNLNAGTLTFSKSDRLPYLNVQDAIEGTSVLCTLVDGVTAPAAVPGYAQIYVDEADGDLKIIYGDGTVKLIVIDT